jgi:TRAP-type uncharacterized transport system substrate-binding protein
MGLDLSLKKTVTEYKTVFDANITHNLTEMANKAGIYKALWRPEELEITKASQLVNLLEEGLAKLKADPEFYRQFDASNGWGIYDDFVPFVERVLEACKEHPDADIEASR